MVESRSLVIENEIKRAEDLMQASKHIEAEEVLRNIDDAAEAGTLTNKAGNGVPSDDAQLKQLHDSDLY
jgi:hypothetical protein